MVWLWLVIIAIPELFIFSSSEQKAHWWAYRIGRPPSSVCLSSTLFLRNHLANQSQSNSYGASMGWGNESLFKGSRSHDKGGHHACIWLKTLKNHLLQNQRANDLETWYAALGAQVLSNLSKLCPWVDLDLFYSKVKFGPLCFCIRKR